MNKAEIWDEIFIIIYNGKKQDQDSTITIEIIKGLLYKEGFELTKKKEQ